MVPIETSGDGPSPPPFANAKALFVREIEEALLSGGIDLAVHSAKDLPAEIPAGLCLASFPPRENPLDSYVEGSAPWEGLGRGSVVGTSSLRRRVQMGLLRPGLAFEPLRGNVGTRLRKLRESGWAGIVLAEAGLRRLGLGGVPRRLMTEDEMVPAPGQGALAVEAREDRPDLLDLAASIDDPASRLEALFERDFMRRVGGGCATPLGALARVEGRGVRLSVFWSRPDGSGALRFGGRCGNSPQEMAALAEELRGRIP
jgi:hydroxymethylbilane synthase